MDGGFEIFYEFKLVIDEMSKKNPAAMAKGIKMIQGTFSDISKHFEGCANVKADFERLKKVSMMMSSSYAFSYEVGKHLILNGIDVFYHVTAAQESWKNKEYFPFGEAVG